MLCFWMCSVTLAESVKPTCWSYDKGNQLTGTFHWLSVMSPDDLFCLQETKWLCKHVFLINMCSWMLESEFLCWVINVIFVKLVNVFVTINSYLWTLLMPLNHCVTRMCYNVCVIMYMTYMCTFLYMYRLLQLPSGSSSTSDFICTICTVLNVLLSPSFYCPQFLSSIQVISCDVIDNFGASLIVPLIWCDVWTVTFLM